ncbi:MAG: ribose transport system ATP-binding protein [Solirubrobacteraceae bacterium]|jgi:ribose transport system ATP-binding protein|nr:ribose transport system ATP-binding protein [Solirubrobacteraceae bacterium]
MTAATAAGLRTEVGPPALAVTRASKTFGAARVLRDVDVTINAGEIRALVGENGSGKSTLVKILAGYHTPDPGSEVAVAGATLATSSPDASDAAGLRFVHQDLALVAELSTVENLGLGRGYGSGVGRPVRWTQQRHLAEQAMVDLGYDVDVTEPVGRLAASERTAVAVARAVSPHVSPPRVLVLDEPTANLPGPEVARLFALVRRVAGSGIAVLFISHHLNEVFELADSVTILRGGALVATQSVDETTESDLIEMMVGHTVSAAQPRRGRREDNIVLRATGLAGLTLQHADLDIAAGEIVGIAGITGSGREAIAPLLFGGAPRSGVVEIAGAPLRAQRPWESIAAGVALVPAERAKNAVLAGHDVSENISIARPRDFVRRGMFRRRLETHEVSKWLGELDVRPPETRIPLAQLSGGNAQKVILARWLRLEPKVLVLDEPTQGVDVGAREDIYRRIEQAAQQGCAVVVCSTDSEELARLCSRVLVLVRGRVRRELDAPLTLDEITAACLTDTKGTDR